MKKKRFILTIITLIIGVLTFVQVILSNNLSTTGIAVTQLDQEVAMYQRQNSLLREAILTKTSLTEISSKAAELGFSTSKSQVVINGQVPIAAKP